MNTKTHLYILFYLMFGTLFLFSCDEERFEVVPSDTVSTEQLYESVSGLKTGLNGIYRYFYSGPGVADAFPDNTGHLSNILTIDILGVDVTYPPSVFGWFSGVYGFQIHQVDNFRVPGAMWSSYYDFINNANAIIGATGEDSPLGVEANPYRGQALAIRAWSYMHLVQAFGQKSYGFDGGASAGVPLYIEQTTEGKARSTVKEVYDQIIADLLGAITLLDGYSTTQISEIDQKVAQGLLARAYLLTENWQEAYNMSSQLSSFDGTDLMSCDEYGSGFREPNDEWLWGMEINEEQSPGYDHMYSQYDLVASSYASLGDEKGISNTLYSNFSSDSTDCRLDVYVGKTDADNTLGVTYQVGKFQYGSGLFASVPLLRMAEIYLMAAEAKAELGDDTEALAIVNALRTARNATAINSTGTALKDDVFYERRFELFGEGIGMFDIKRKGIAWERDDSHGSLSFVRSLPANSNRLTFAIPVSEIEANKALSENDQNTLTD